MSYFQSAKLAVMASTGLSKDALHIYVGLMVMFGIALVLKRSLADWRPIAAVALVALVGEVWDIFDSIRSEDPVSGVRTFKDISNTLFWPAVLFALARFTHVLKR